MVTATLAASSRGKAKSSQEHKLEGSAKAHRRFRGRQEEATEVSEARSQWAPWGNNTHARELPRRETREIQEARQRVSSCDPPKRSRVP
jgi:hypothetical protein